MTTKKQIVDFKQAVDIILHKGNTRIDSGICFELFSITKQMGSSNDIMAALLTHSEYDNGIGPNGVLDKNRQTFLMLLQAMSVEDIESIVFLNYYLTF